MNYIQFLGSVEIGLLYGIVAIAIYLTFRVINFPDLTVDGSFPLGAATCAGLITSNVHPMLAHPAVATLMAMAAGAVAGFATGYLHVRWKILGLLAGILTMTALYSINLRVMGRPNIALISEPTLFPSPQLVLPILAIGVILIILGLAYFLNSQFGLALRAVGINPRVSPAYGINVGKRMLVGLCLSNALVAGAGALFAQIYGFADVSMGTGILIIGLASVIVGETLFHSYRLWIILLSCVVGSVLYRLAIAFALNTHFIGLKTSDLNLITAALVVVALLFPNLRKRMVAFYRGNT
jgi:putative ABC transport system permease protein